MRLHVTEVGRQLAMSGLMPDTADYLLSYLARNFGRLEAMVTNEPETSDPKRLDFCLISACLTSPEFSSQKRTRFIPFGFDEFVENIPAETYQKDLAEPQWQAYRSAMNAAMLLLDWIDGTSIGNLEQQFRNVSAGSIQGIAREVVWCLSGLVNILASATRRELSAEERPVPFRDRSLPEIGRIRKLIATLRLLVWRINVGLPASILWMSELKTEAGKRAVSNKEARALLDAGLDSFESLRQRRNWLEVIQALTKAGSKNPNGRAGEIQSLAFAWHETVRQRSQQRQIRRLNESDHRIISDLYETKEKAFEAAFEAALCRAEIRFTKFDDGKKPGAFDYLIHIEDRDDFIVECKTKKDNGLADMSDARVVLSSSELYGYKNTFCVTLCQPGIDPNVPEHLKGSERLSIIETHDIAEAITRLINKSLTPQAFCDWITQPGVAKSENLLTQSILPSDKT